jgi:hypothetical protein
MDSIDRLIIDLRKKQNGHAVFLEKIIHKFEMKYPDGRLRSLQDYLSASRQLRVYLDLDTEKASVTGDITLKVIDYSKALIPKKEAKT